MLLCAGAPKKGYASRNVLRVTSGTTAFQEEQAAKKGIAPQTVRPNAAADSPTGYGPSDLQSAYGLTRRLRQRLRQDHRHRRRLRRPERRVGPGQHPRQSGSDAPVRSLPPIRSTAGRTDAGRPSSTGQGL